MGMGVGRGADIDIGIGSGREIDIIGIDQGIGVVMVRGDKTTQG